MAKYITKDGILTKYEYEKGDRDIVIPDGITRIGTKAFFSSKIRSVTIPETVRYIGADAFYWCDNLAEVHIPDSVKFIKSGAFSGCIKLQNISIPDNVTVIEDDTFSGCENLREIVLSSRIKEIGKGAFAGCSSLSSISLPNVYKIGDYAFKGCSSLENAELSQKLHTIGIAAFHDTPFLENDTRDYIIYGTVVYDYRGNDDDITIPDGITTIGYYAFSRLNISSVTIPESVITINSYAFTQTGLKTVNIPNAQTIGYDAFAYCDLLTDAVVPDIPLGGVFRGCKALKKVTVPNKSEGDDIPVNIKPLSELSFPEISRMIHSEPKAIERYIKKPSPELLEKTDPAFYNALKSIEFDSSPRFILGKDKNGVPLTMDLEKYQHVLVTVTNASDKDKFFDSFILSCIMNYTPQDVCISTVNSQYFYKFEPLFQKPWRYDSNLFIRHDDELEFAVQEMFDRKKLFSECGVETFDEYNELAKERADLDTLPHMIVAVYDLNPKAEMNIWLLSENSHSLGIHMIIATDDTSPYVLTDLIISSIPTFIAFNDDPETWYDMQLYSAYDEAHVNLSSYSISNESIDTVIESCELSFVIYNE